jgi:hypothetical protein
VAGTTLILSMRSYSERGHSGVRCPLANAARGYHTMKVNSAA